MEDSTGDRFPPQAGMKTDNRGAGLKDKIHLKKNQDLHLTIEDFTREGEGLGKYHGFPFFVKDTVIGDVVAVTVTKVKKNYGYARLKEVLVPSPDRVDPPCPVARQCGGCKIQQLAYDRQLEYKFDLVKSCLERIGGFAGADRLMEPIYGMEDPWHYRNKAQFPVGGDRQGRLVAGFYAGRTHTIVANRDCLIQAPVNREILDLVLMHMEKYKIEPYHETGHTGLVRHILTRVGYHTGQIMVCLVLNGKADSFAGIKKLARDLAGIEGMTSLVVNSNMERTNRILGPACQTVWGQDYIEDYIGEVKYQIGPLSFFQVNPRQTEVLYGKALEYADLSGHETVWDLYCGIGTISLFLAGRARKVYGVEIVEAAVEDARRNAAVNGFENVEFFAGKAEEVVPAHFEKTGDHPDVIVVDPPRKGCDSRLLETMLAMAPEKIVYVSCDPGTLARDLKILCFKDYELKKVAVVDQFAHSCHVETVVRLDRRSLPSPL